ncbi:MAG: Non-viral sialidase [Akkermansiaceae bacterium]|nr:Non-viral sialidase [Akkermansiaceae bacterium]
MKTAATVLALFASIFSVCEAAETIRWKEDTRILVQPGGHYGRIARLDAKTLLCVFTFKQALQFRRSRDDGRTWEDPRSIASWPPGTLANAEILVLKNGGILAFFNRRPDRANPTGLPYSIGCCRSADHGATWSEPVTIHEAGTTFGDGCWEPAALELPDGRIAVWFANEGPYRTSDEQEISVAFSADRGTSWSAAQRFSFRAGHRDGMPVPLLAPDGKSVRVAIEDNGLSGTFKPVILLAPLGSNGSFAPIDATSQRRRAALAAPLPPKAYAGAPYLRALPGGALVLSFQFASSGDMKDSRMAVCLGKDRPPSFSPPSFPFPAAPPEPAQLWNSLFIKNRNTVTALSETTWAGQAGIWIVDGEVASAP